MPFPAEDGPTSATSSQWNGLKSDGLRSYTYSGGGGSALPGQGNPIYQPPPGERKKELDRFFLKKTYFHRVDYEDEMGPHPPRGGGGGGGRRGGAGRRRGGGTSYSYGGYPSGGGGGGASNRCFKLFQFHAFITDVFPPGTLWTTTAL